MSYEIEYAVGDRVVTTGEEDSDEGYYISGLRGVVSRINIDEDGLTYEVEFDSEDLYRQWVEPQEIKLVPFEAQFEAGNKVRVRYDSPLRGVGSVGVIGYIDLDDPDLPYRVDFEDDFGWYGEDDLEAWDETKPNYSVGDVLIATDRLVVPGTDRVILPGTLGYVVEVTSIAYVYWEGHTYTWSFPYSELKDTYLLSKQGEGQNIADPLWAKVVDLRKEVFLK